jgi:hypothetical protein
MAATIDSGRELTAEGIFLRAPRLTGDDFDEYLSDNDVNTIEEFEDEWKIFLSSHPGILPSGTKIKNCRRIQNQINEMDGKKQNICLELQNQLDFFTNSKDQLKVKYTMEMEAAALQQQEVIHKLDREIDDIAEADKSLSTVLPWEHFFDNLESNTTITNHGSVASSTVGSHQPIKPSNEALYLSNIDNNEVVEAARRGNSKPRLLRAYRIDNALLKAKSAMLKIEADRLEKTIKSERLLSKFLVEHDIQTIMHGQ